LGDVFGRSNAFNEAKCFIESALVAETRRYVDMLQGVFLLGVIVQYLFYQTNTKTVDKVIEIVEILTLQRQAHVFNN
jgi:hypothetical protein